MTNGRRTIVALLLAVGSLLSACGPARPPIPPGEIPRIQSVTPEDEQYGQEVLSQLTQQFPLERNDRDINRTRDVVMDLARAAGADREPWNVYVLKGDSVINAAATRGNHVFVWTGMLRAVKNDGELATVLAHEIGHVLAGHTMPTPSEEASEILAEASGQIAGELISTQGAYGALAGIAAAIVSETIKAIVVNPESQRKELEADQIGLFLMSDARYDPRDAIELWKRLLTQQGIGESPLGILSSHPPTTARIEALEAMLPEALERFHHATGRPVDRRPDPTFRKSDSFAIPGPGDVPPSRRNPAPPPPVRDNTARGPRSTDRPRPPVELRNDPADSTNGRTETWIVSEEETSIRTDPAAGAPIVSTLKKGAKVDVGFRLGGWYQVVSPDKGYIRGADISPLK